MVASEVIHEQWEYAGSTSLQPWLLYTYNNIRRCVMPHVFGERTIMILERLLNLLSTFEVVMWMMDGRYMDHA